MARTWKIGALSFSLIMAVTITVFWPGWDFAQAATDAAPKKVANHLASPVSALLSPAGARLENRQKEKLRPLGENCAVDIFVPQDAANLLVSVPGKTVIRWNSEPVALESASGHATRRMELEKTCAALESRLNTVKARIAVWQAQTQAASPQELSQRQTLMQEQLPQLGEELADLERSLSQARDELSQIPSNSGVGQRIEVVLVGAPKPGESVVVEYSYDVMSCGWNPVYEFDAAPDGGQGDIVKARLLAEVWQYTGIDWDGTKIVLASRGNGPREPKPLRKWHVGNSEASRPEPTPTPKDAPHIARGAVMKLSADKAAPAAHVEEDAAPTLAASAPVVADSEPVYATWTLAASGLPEGRSRMLIVSEDWKAPLQWLARPSTDDNDVWLMAKFNLPQDQVWPAGYAHYSVDGQSVGEGAFKPRGGEAILYFGSDPRMSVHTTIDSNRQGETGFINTSKTWTGAWTYTISNAHSVPVRVRVERPEPIVGNDNITVTYKDNPKSAINEKEHMIYWVVEVPAHGKTSIEHSVTISSPVKLPLFPDVP